MTKFEDTVKEMESQVEELENDLADKADQLDDAGKEKAKALVEKTEEAIKSSIEKVRSIINDVQEDDKLDEFLDKVKAKSMEAVDFTKGKVNELTQKAIATATKAAKAVVETNHSDTLAMQNAILEAKAMQSEFQVTGDTAVINSYNRAFKKYLQENDPGLAKEMFIERPKDLPEDEQWDEFEQLVKVTNPQEQ